MDDLSTLIGIAVGGVVFVASFVVWRVAVAVRKAGEPAVPPVVRDQFDKAEAEERARREATAASEAAKISEDGKAPPKERGNANLAFLRDRRRK